jgi:hypothetical protein
MNTHALRKLEGRLACVVRRLQLLEESMTTLPNTAVIGHVNLAKHRAYDGLELLRAHIEQARDPRGLKAKPKE